MGTFLPLVVAAVANMIIGMIWYSESVFGKEWMKLVGLTSAKIKSMQKDMSKSMLSGFVAALVTAYVLNIIIGYAGVADALGGAKVGLLVWLGFIATSSLGSVLWEGKSMNLYYLNNGYSLVNLAVMGAILAAM